MNSHTMKSVNIMNFARQCEPRDAETDALLFQTTKQQLEMLNELQLPNTFLLQYDALCDARFVQLFREQAGPNTETGLWYEIVEPLTTACGMPYESENGWKWDWHIKPGFSMAYPPRERDRLIDAEWAPEQDGKQSYTVEIKVFAQNRTGLLVDISRIFSDRGVDLTAINVRLNKQNIATMEMTFDVTSRDELMQIMQKIRQVESVTDVSRTVG